RRRLPKVASPFLFDLAALTAYFSLLGFLSLIVPSQYTFPRVTWGLAWLFSIVGFAAYSATRNIGLGIQERAPFSRSAQLFIDAVVVFLALGFSYVIRFDGLPPPTYQHQFILVAPYLVVVYLLVDQLWGVGRFVWRFTSIREAVVIGLAVTTTALIVLVTRIVVLEHYASFRVPFGILLVHAPLVYIGLLGARGLRRIQYRSTVRSGRRHPDRAGRRRVLLVGAGDAGVQLLDELDRRRDFQVVGFLDDDRRKLRRTIRGVRVLGSTHRVREVASEKAVEEVILSMPTADKSAVHRIVADCEDAGLKVSSVPSLAEILLGRVRVSRLRPVRIEDLLGRDSVEFPADDGDLQAAYRDKRILVTGGAGSIGSEIVRQLRAFEPQSLVLLDKDENGLFEKVLDLREEFAGRMVEVVADIRDRRRLERVFGEFEPEVVLHAAAYKHVPMMEHNPSEAVTNNIFGTRNVIEAAVEHGCERFVLISTDKAVNPTSVMGASKRMAEMVMRCAASKTPRTRLCCVRFGNVLGSRASVVPIFQKRIAEGKNIKVTHPDIQRYFMTIPEAVQLVLQAGSLATCGETFVLDMGDPVKIADLARDLIEQSGLVLGEDIDIEYTGLRPGEKMFEELLTKSENGVRNTRYPKIFTANPVNREERQLLQALESLERTVQAGDDAGIYSVFSSLDFGYRRRVVPLGSRNAG
ncbi:MAG: nucleoside-diphosphate sugar epimerase/dehydratase, partial [Acidobacteriota bacterium]